MAEFIRLDQGKPVEVAGRVGLVPMLFRIIPDDPEDDERFVYSVQKYTKTTDVVGNDSWQDANQALWLMGQPSELSKALKELSSAIQKLDRPGGSRETGER